MDVDRVTTHMDQEKKIFRQRFCLHQGKDASNPRKNKKYILLTTYYLDMKQLKEGMAHLRTLSAVIDHLIATDKELCEENVNEAYNQVAKFAMATPTLQDHVILNSYPTRSSHSSIPTSQDLRQLRLFHVFSHSTN